MKARGVTIIIFENKYDLETSKEKVMFSHKCHNNFLKTTVKIYSLVLYYCFDWTESDLYLFVIN